MTHEETLSVFDMISHLIDLRDFEKAHRLLDELFTAPVDQQTTAEATRNRGLIAWRQHNFSEAIRYYSEALELFTAINDEHGMATSRANVGVGYGNMGDYHTSLQHLMQSLAISENLNDVDAIASALGNIGIVYKGLQDYDNAFAYYSRALEINLKQGNKRRIANNSSNLGFIYEQNQNFPLALEYYSRAVDLFDEIGDSNGKSIAYGNLAALYQNMSMYSHSMELLLKAIAIDEESGNNLSIVIHCGNIGCLYYNEEYEGMDLALSEEYLLKGLQLAQEINAREFMYECHLHLAKLYKIQERWKENSYHFEQYHIIESDVKNEQAIQRAEQYEHRRKLEESERDRVVKLARFQEQEKILYNILPSSIAQRVVDGEKTIAESLENVSVFFSDIVGFTELSQKVSAEDLVRTLNNIFTEFDRLTRKHGLEKIKTIGDAYMAVCGAPVANSHHALHVAMFALDVQQAIHQLTASTGEQIDIRIGLHCGNVVAGIIGENKFAYDLWGDAVNTASRMESHGEAGKIHVSEEFIRNLTPALSKREGEDSSSFPFGEDWDGVLRVVPRGEMEIKGKGMMRTYFLEKTQ